MSIISRRSTPQHVCCSSAVTTRPEMTVERHLAGHSAARNCHRAADVEPAPYHADVLAECRAEWYLAAGVAPPGRVLRRDDPGCGASNPHYPGGFRLAHHGESNRCGRAPGSGQQWRSP